MEFFDFARRGGIIDLTSGLNEEKPDADLSIIDDLDIETIIAKGEIMIENGEL